MTRSNFVQWIVFQSTPLCEGRRLLLLHRSFHECDFNPRPSARGDSRRWLGSICHADFNPRPSARGDWPTPSSRIPTSRFQSTPLCEGRLLLRRRGCDLAHFNPRPSARGDCRWGAHLSTKQTFQSTPLCEGRLNTPADIWVINRISIHAPLRGATANIYKIRRRCLAKVYKSFSQKARVKSKFKKI